MRVLLYSPRPLSCVRPSARIIRVCLVLLRRLAPLPLAKPSASAASCRDEQLSFHPGDILHICTVVTVAPHLDLHFLNLNHLT